MKFNKEQVGIEEHFGKKNILVVGNKFLKLTMPFRDSVFNIMKYVNK